MLDGAHQVRHRNGLLRGQSLFVLLKAKKKENINITSPDATASPGMNSSG